MAAIYEPPQTSSRDHVTLLPDPKEEVLEELARRLGLRRVGWLFTDLLPEDVASGTVKHIRYVDITKLMKVVEKNSRAKNASL